MREFPKISLVTLAIILVCTVSTRMQGHKLEKTHSYFARTKLAI